MSQDARIGTEIAGYRVDALFGRGGLSFVSPGADLRPERPAALEVPALELAAG